MEKPLSDKSILSDRNYQVPFLKFIFSIIVLLNHIGRYLANAPEILKRHQGSFAVEFFFICSGYFMVNSYFKSDNNTDTCAGNTWMFMKRKISNLALPVTIGYVISFIIRIGDLYILGNNNFSNISNIFAYGIESITEGFVIHGTGLHLFPATGITWYISCMLISMLLLYYLLCRYKDTFLYIIAPLTGILITAYMYKVIGGYDSWENFSGIVSIGLIRAIGGLCLGCTAYVISEKLSKIQFTKVGRVSISILEIIIYAAIFYGLFIYSYSFAMHSALTIWIVPLVAVIMSKISYVSLIFTNPKWNMLGTVSLYIYISHWRIVMLFANHFNDLSFKKSFVLIWFFVIVLSFVEYGIYRIIKSNGNKIKLIFIETDKFEQ